jgi:hypothetical protein
MLLASLHMPRGARFEPLPDGFAFVFDDPTTRVEVHERIAPLRRARAIFDAALGIATTAPIREYLTRDGEHAALLDLASASRRVISGITYADDFYRLVIGHTADEARAEDIAKCVRELTLSFSLDLAEDRRRRFRYAPPAGWSSRSRHGLITEWLAPEFPSDAAMISVFPSSPMREMPSRVFDRSMHEMQWGGFVASACEGPFPFAAPRLHAEDWRLVGRWGEGARVQIDLVVLHDNARTYLVRLEHDGSRDDEHRATLHALATSIVPIGRGRVASGAASTSRALLAHVVD